MSNLKSLKKMVSPKQLAAAKKSGMKFVSEKIFSTAKKFSSKIKFKLTLTYDC